MPLTPHAPVAVFDMDGVLIHQDAFGSFVRAHLRSSPVPLAAVAAAWPWLLTPALLPATRRWAVGRLLGVALAGLDDERYEEAVRAFGADLATRPHRVVHEAVAEARGLDEAGYRVIICTACEVRLARAYIDGIGLGDLEVIGSELAFGRRGARATWSNHGENKVAALRGAGVGVPWSVSYSDALGDLPLLRSAERAVLVNPDDWLRSRVTTGLGRPADEVDWPAVPRTRAVRQAAS